MTNSFNIGQLLGWIAAIIFLAIGIVNSFWGNDPFFGVFIILLSGFFFPPVGDLLAKWTGLSLPWWLKLLLAIFILWASVGVGELFDKVDMMLADIS